MQATNYIQPSFYVITSTVSTEFNQPINQSMRELKRLYSLSYGECPDNEFYSFEELFGAIQPILQIVCLRQLSDYKQK